MHLLRRTLVVAWIAYSVMGALYTCRIKVGLDAVMGPLVNFFQTEKFPVAVSKQVKVYTWAHSEESHAERPLAELVRTKAPGWSRTRVNSLAASYRDYLEHVCKNASETPKRFIIRETVYDIGSGGKPSVGLQACLRGQGLQ